MGLNEFIKHKPPKFSGIATSDQADQWIKELEKIFRATSCPKDKKLIFVVYMLFSEDLRDRASPEQAQPSRRMT